LVTITPSVQGSNSLPASRTYTVNVTNNDGVVCGASGFNLASELPSGMSGTWSTATLTLAPRTSGTATFTLNAPSGLADNNYAFNVGTVAADGHAAGQANATFSVDTTAPGVPAGLKASVTSNGKVTLQWTASTDGAGSGIAKYRVLRNGALLATTATTTFSQSPGTGTFSYTIAAEDHAGNVSAPSAAATVTIQKKTGPSKR